MCIYKYIYIYILYTYRSLPLSLLFLKHIQRKREAPTP